MNQAYHLNFRKVGQDVTIWETAKIIDPQNIEIGDSVIIDDFVFVMGGKQTCIGSFVHIAVGSSIAGGGELIMEDFTTLSHGVRLFTGNDNYLGGSLTNSTIPDSYRQPERSFVHIKKHSIVGANTVVLPSIIIGEGVAIGANSLVKNHCEEWCIYAGNPAKFIKKRPKETILELEEKLKQNLYDAQNIYIPKQDR